MDYLNSFSNSLTASLGGVVPNILAALLVLIIGLLLAGVIRRIIRGLFKRTQIDERISRKMSFDFNLGNFIATMAYYLAVMFVLLLVLNMMGVDSVLDPLKNMLNKFVGYIPNIIGAGIIGFVGYIVAKIASEAVGFISETVESFSMRIGFKNPQGLTNILKQLVFIFVFVPILIQAIAALNMEAISQPATEMLSTLLNSIPNILAAFVILAVVYFVGSYVVSVLKQLMRNLGVDDLSEKLGLQSVLGNNSLSVIIGNIAFFFLIFFGLIAALEQLELFSISVILTEVFYIAGQVFFGLIILLAGTFIANLAAKAVSNSPNGAWLSSVVRFAVLGIFLAFALHTMGIAQTIVNLAFGLTLGAVAVAFALAFGLGGREAAGKQLDLFFDKMRNNGKK